METQNVIENQVILDDFVGASLEHLSDVEDLLLEIQGNEPDLETVNSVFWAYRSVQQPAGFLGFTVINRLSQKLEEVLGLLLAQELTVDSDVVDQLIRSSERLRGLLRDAAISNTADVAEHIAALEAIGSSENAC
jgi:two-component system chemotaxis sensor kinase CheA